MTNGSRRKVELGLALAVVVMLSTPLTYGQAKPEKAKGECNAYRVDNQKNRVHFNAPEPWIAIPTKEERNQLRTQGDLGQVFVMENCDTPDLISRIKVYGSPEEGEKDGGAVLTEIASGQPVLILEQRSGWYRIKGRSANVGSPVIWNGEGWIKPDSKTIIIKY